MCKRDQTSDVAPHADDGGEPALFPVYCWANFKARQREKMRLNVGSEGTREMRLFPVDEDTK